MESIFTSEYLKARHEAETLKKRVAELEAENADLNRRLDEAYQINTRESSMEAVKILDRLKKDFGYLHSGFSKYQNAENSEENFLSLKAIIKKAFRSLERIGVKFEDKKPEKIEIAEKVEKKCESAMTIAEIADVLHTASVDGDRISVTGEKATEEFAEICREYAKTGGNVSVTTSGAKTIEFPSRQETYRFFSWVMSMRKRA